MTSIICLAIRARLLTFAASDLVNGNPDPDMVQMQNCDGEPIFSATHDAERWKTALDANKLLIDEAEKAGHKLYVKMAGNDIDPFQSYQGALMLRDIEGNKEILFPRTFESAGYFDRQANPRGMGGAGAIGITQSLVDAFFMRNGLPPILGYTADGAVPVINTESGYSETGYSTEDEKFKTTWMYGAPGGSEQNSENVVVPKNTFRSRGSTSRCSTTKPITGARHIARTLRRRRPTSFREAPTAVRRTTLLRPAIWCASASIRRWSRSKTAALTRNVTV